MLLKVWQRFELQDEKGNPVQFDGQLSDSKALTISVTNTDDLKRKFQLATTANQKVYDSAADLPATPAFGWLENLSLTDPLDVEMVADNGGNQVVYTGRIAPSFTALLSSFVSYDSTHVEGWGTPGTLVQIDTINVYNPSVANTVDGLLYLTD